MCYTKIGDGTDWPLASSLPAPVRGNRVLYFTDTETEAQKGECLPQPDRPGLRQSWDQEAELLMPSPVLLPPHHTQASLVKIKTLFVPTMQTQLEKKKKRQILIILSLRRLFEHVKTTKYNKGEMFVLELDL